MADTGEDLRAFLLTDSAVTDLVGTRVYQNAVPETASLPFVWFIRRRSVFVETLGESDNTPFQEYYDIECVNDTMTDAMQLADAVRVKLNGHGGTMGDNAYNWVAVLDQFDEYVTRNTDDDAGIHVVSLRVEVTNS